MDFLLHTANVFLLISFSVRSMLLLRALNLVAGSFFIAWALTTPDPIWSSAIWNMLFGAVNLWRIYLAILERRPPQLSVEEQRLHKDVFSSFDPRAVRKLFDLGKWENGLPPSLLVAGGAVSDRVWMVAEGQINVQRDAQTIREIRVGDFVGEASFLTKRPMPADVVVASPVRFMSWANDDLERFMTERPDIASGLQRVFGACLVRKLHSAQAA